MKFKALIFAFLSLVVLLFSVVIFQEWQGSQKWQESDHDFIGPETEPRLRINGLRRDETDQEYFDSDCCGGITYVPVDEPLDSIFDLDPDIRTSFGPRGCLTVAHPSAGGIVVGYFTPPEVDWLALSRAVEEKRSTSSADEDELAGRMLRLGAHWWPHWAFLYRHRHRMQDKGKVYDFHYPPSLYVGYPEGEGGSDGGGVWVLKYSPDRYKCRNPSIPREPESFEWRIRMTTTMDERCAVLKDFGATYYKRPEDCEDLAMTLDDGIARGKRHERALRKMEHRRYRVRWEASLDYGINWGMSVIDIT